MSTAVAERPDPVPEVVVRHGHEERAGRGQAVVEVGAVEQRRVDGQIDGVARDADDAELGELLPVVPLAQSVRGAGAHAEKLHDSWRG